MIDHDMAPRLMSFRTDTGSVVDSVVRPLGYQHPVLAAELAEVASNSVVYGSGGRVAADVATVTA